MRQSATFARSDSGESSETAPRSKTRPTTDPRCATVRSPASRLSSRAAIRREIDLGTATSSMSGTAAQVPSASRTRWPASTSMARNSSTKSGLPSAASRIRARSGPGKAGPPGNTSTSADAFEASSGSRRMIHAFGRSSPQSGRASRSSGRAGQSSRIGASRLQSTIEPPACRAAQVPPSGRPRRGRPADGLRRGRRTTGAPPR